MAKAVAQDPSPILPADKIAVKPNFAYPDPGLGAGTGGYAVFVGRLSA